MKNIFIAFAIILITNTVSAQNFGEGYGSRQFTSDLFQMDEYIKRQNKGIDFKDTESYTGTPYNNPSYLIGNIYRNNELWATNIAIRYNAMADEMEIKESLQSPDEDARVLTKSPDVFVKIASDIYIFAPYKGGIEGGGYFQILFEGTKLDLYKKWVKNFTAKRPATTSLTKDIPASFKDDPIYYLVDKAGKFYEMPSSRTKKLKVFADHKNEMKDYVRKAELDLNNEQDLIKAIRYYNTL